MGEGAVDAAANAAAAAVDFVADDGAVGEGDAEEVAEGVVVVAGGFSAGGVRSGS
jgi:hypothetical protein